MPTAEGGMGPDYIDYVGQVLNIFFASVFISNTGLLESHVPGENLEPGRSIRGCRSGQAVLKLTGHTLVCGPRWNVPVGECSGSWQGITVRPLFIILN